MSRLPRFLDDLPIRRKLAWLAASASMLGLLLFGLAASVLLRWSAEQSVAQQAATLEPLLRAALTGPMIEHDYATVREIADELVKSDVIEAITILTNDGVVVADMQSWPQPESTFSITRTIELEESAVSFGQVSMRIGAGGFALLLSRLGVAMLLAAFMTLTLVTVLFRLYARRLTNRLSRLAAAAHEIAAGRFDARVEDAVRDEIGRLADDFNHMAETVQSAFQELSASEGEVTAILQSIGDGLLTTDKTMRVTYLNPVAEALTGWTEAEARGRGVAEILKIENALTGQPAEIPVGRVLETGLVVGLANHTVLIAKDGRRHHISDSAAPIRDGSGRLLGVVMVFRDITESYRLRADLDASRTRLELALKGANLGLWDRDLETDRLVVDARWAGMLGYRPDDFAGQADPWIALIHPDDLPVAKRAFKDHLEGRAPQYEAEFRMRTKDGQWRWILSRGRVTERDADGRPLRVTGTHLDITERRAAQDEIERLAFYDSLTHLPNRRLLLDRLDRELAEARRNGQHGALLFIDLDQFKQVNDAYGHSAGDAVLCECAARLKGQLREMDSVARLGGDEFVVLLPRLATDSVTAAAAAQHVAEKLRLSLSRPYELDAIAGQCHLGASIGVVLFPDGMTESCETLLSHADTAMYQAKEGGRNAICFFEPAMQALVEERLALENDLRAAIAAEAFELYLQGQHDAEGHIVGAEVLLRWTHPKRGVVPPTSFIPLAEATGMIEALGEWVLRRATILLKNLEDAGHDLRLAVNISPRQFRNTDFVSRVRSILAETGASPSRLVLEITESLLLSDLGEATARMHELQALGIRFSIDDFGTGYSSLSYLKRLPIDELKIDRAFVAGLPQDSDDAALSKTILLIAQQMHLEVIAEGVEREAQLDWLRHHGCRHFQGYLFGRPQPEATFLARLGVSP